MGRIIKRGGYFFVYLVRLGSDYILIIYYTSGVSVEVYMKISTDAPLHTCARGSTARPPNTLPHFFFP